MFFPIQERRLMAIAGPESWRERWRMMREQFEKLTPFHGVERVFERPLDIRHPLVVNVDRFALCSLKNLFPDVFHTSFDCAIFAAPSISIMACSCSIAAA